MIAGAEITKALVATAQPQPGMLVLDVACGAGEAALNLAPLVKPSGRVIAIDLVAEMLPRRPQSAQITECNVSFCVADGEELPFRADSFDLVTSRMAIMHFPNPLCAAAETLRILRPGGRFVLTALGLEQVTSALVQILIDHGAIPPKLPDLPDPHRFGTPGALASMLTSVGFHDVYDRALTCSSPWPGTAEQFWQAMPEHGFYVADLIQSLTPKARGQAEAETLALLGRHEVDGTVQLPVHAVIATGVRGRDCQEVSGGR